MILRLKFWRYTKFNLTLRNPLETDLTVVENTTEKNTTETSILQILKKETEFTSWLLKIKKYFVVVKFN